MTTTVSVTIICDHKTIVSNKIKKIENESTYDNFLEQFYLETGSDDIIGATIKKITVWRLGGTIDEFEVEKSDKFASALEFGNIKFIKYMLEGGAPATHPDTNLPSAFTVLMSGSQPRQLNEIRPEVNKKHELHNSVLRDMQQNGPLLVGGNSQDTGHDVLKRVTDGIWYLDGRQKTVCDAVSYRGSKITPIPERFKKYEGFQNWKQWKRKPRMEKKQCDDLAKSLRSAVNRLSIRWPRDWADDIITLASTFSTYAEYLRTENDQQAHRQMQSTPARQISKDATSRFWASVSGDKVHKHLRILSDIMKQEEEYTPILIDFEEHFDPAMTDDQKYYHCQHIDLEVPVQEIRYDPGGGSSVMRFLYRVTEEATDDERTTMAIRILKEIEPDIPVYSTREMRRQFKQSVALLHYNDIPKHVLRHVYRTLTGDCSTDDVSGVDERVKTAIDTNDPDLVADLRHLNKGRPADTFKDFFESLGKVVEERTAADDRRHGIAHMSDFLSVRDLIDQVKNDLPEGTAIPSEATVLYAFSSPNTHVKSAQYYTGKVQLKHMVQKRQLRAFHSDAHYCNAQYRYIREMAILEKDDCLLLSCDDKAKVDFGEPGFAISSGVRGKRSIVPTTTLLGALDHDVNQKGSITPSVSLLIDIPDDIASTFYRGQVIITLKDSVFEPSSAFRFATELKYSLLNSVDATKLAEVKTIFLVTDGGPEHRVTFESVKLSLIALFLELKLERLVAIRTAPGQSYVNPVERIMSVLNIGLQNVALERDECSSDTVISKCKNLEDLRKHGEEIKQDWKKSIAPLSSNLEQRLQRLVLKEKPFKIQQATTEESIEEFAESTAVIDDSLPGAFRNNKMTKADLHSNVGYHKFIRNHCKEGLYMFQVRQCENIDCCATDHVRPWCPYPMEDPARPGHYKTFSDSYNGEETTEDDTPSLKNNIRKVTEEQQGCPASVLTGQNVREIIACTSCAKPRCIYAKRKLTDREIRSIRSIKRIYHYECGCVVTPDDSALNGVIFSKLELTCSAPIEWAYYTSQQGKKDICCHCGHAGAVTDSALKDVYKVVLPMCKTCEEKGRSPLTRQPLHTASAKRAAKKSATGSKSKKSK